MHVNQLSTSVTVKELTHQKLQWNEIFSPGFYLDINNVKTDLSFIEIPQSENIVCLWKPQAI